MRERRKASTKGLWPQNILEDAKLAIMKRLVLLQDRGQLGSRLSLERV